MEMPSVEISDVLGTLSAELIGSDLLLTERFVRFTSPDKLVFEPGSQVRYSCAENFWESIEGDGGSLSSDRRRDIFHQVQRSRASHLVAKVALLALKSIGQDQQIVLTHKGVPVTNVLGMNCQAMDVSDLVGKDEAGGSMIWMVDSCTGKQCGTIVTEAEMETRAPAQFTANVRHRQHTDEHFTQYCGLQPCERVPHWWIGVQCPAARDLVDTRDQLVHFDMMCTAFGEFAYIKSERGEVPLHCFSSECPWMRPADDVTYGHKFHLTSWANSDESRFIAFDASVRHFRAYTEKRGTFIEVTPMKHIVSHTPEWNQDLRDGCEIAKRVAAQVFVRTSGVTVLGTRLCLTGLLKRPELNGKSVRVDDAGEASIGGRIGIQLNTQDGGHNIRVKIENLRCLPSDETPNQFKTLAQMKGEMDVLGKELPEELRKVLGSKSRQRAQTAVDSGTDYSTVQQRCFVRIVGLLSAAGAILNRRVGTVVAATDDGVRWGVLLQPENATKAVKAENLEVIGHPDCTLSDAQRLAKTEAFRAQLHKDGRLERLFGQVQLGALKFTAYDSEGIRNISQALVDFEYFRAGASDQLHYDHCRLHYWAAENPESPRAREILAEFQRNFFKDEGGRRLFDPSTLTEEAQRRRCVALHREVTSTPGLRLVFRWLKSEGLLRLASDVLVEQSGADVLGERLELI